MAQHTVVVAGNGEVSKSAVYDLLADWLGYEEDGEEFAATDRADEIHFVFLAHPDLISKTLQHVYNWTGRANIDYTAVYARRHNTKAVELIVENAETAHASGEVEDIYRDAAAFLDEQEGKKTLLILSDTDGDDGKDAGCDEFVITASKAGTEILDLGCGLIGYPVQKAVERVMQGQAAEEVEEEPEAEQLEVPAPTADLQEDIAEAHRAQEATTEVTDSTELTPLLLKLVTVVEGVIREVDSKLNADFYQERSALDEVRDALQPVKSPKPAPTPDGPYPVEDTDEEEPAPAAPKDVRKGWYNEELNEYLPFRGRPRRDVEKHDIVQDPDTGKWVKYEPVAA
ncbi:hypothetical protein [Streptomyces sp. NPDC018584]|uniref:hypothetical protein n=1 Tax=unclassified Streptomyces TaxID=2593676 RepID=UPI00379A7762